MLCVILHKSYRYRFFNVDNRQEAEIVHAKKSFVIASWHQNCFAGILAHAGQGFALLVSRSLDGEIVSRLAKAIGLQTVRGSSKKGGQEALDVLIERTHGGLKSAFTVDGPKGPIFEIKRGVFVLAAETGAPILPMAAISLGTSFGFQSPSRKCLCFTVNQFMCRLMNSFTIMKNSGPA